VHNFIGIFHQLFFNIFISLFSILKSSTAVLLFSLYLAGIGKFLTRLLNYKITPSFPLLIAYGIASIVFIGYYAHLLDLSLKLVFNILIIIGFLLILGDFFYSLRQSIIYKNQFTPIWLCSKKTVYYLFFIATLFFILNLVTLHTHIVSPGGNGNNDVYFWAASADQLLNKFQFSTILPAGQPLWTFSVFKDDYIGSYLTIAFTSIFFKSNNPALLIMPLLLGSMITWISLTIIELLILLFSIRKSTALAITLIVTFGNFFHYIVYNFFVGEILATFIFLNIFYCGLVFLLRNKTEPFLRIVTKLFPIIGLLLITYPRSFVVFFSILLLYLVFINFSQLTKKDSLLQVAKINITMLVSLIFSFLTYPAISQHLYRATLCASSSTLCASISPTGWPLPLLNAFYLFSLPFPFSLSASSPLLSNTFLSAISLFLISITMFCLIRAITNNRKNYPLQDKRVLYYLAFAFVAAVLLYIFAFYVRGDTYQVWKFAAYVIMPMSFIPIAVLVIYLKNALSHFLQCIILFFVLSCLLLSSYRSSGVNDFNIINNLIFVSKQIKRDAKIIILDLSPYRETMVAMNIFSKNHTIIPLAQTYLLAAKLPLTDLGSTATWVTTQQCANLLQYGKSELPQNVTFYKYVILNNSTIVGKSSSIIGGVYFSSQGGPCLLGHFLNIVSGLSDPEPFGRWSNAKKVLLQYEIPSVLRGRPITFIFKLTPFLSSNLSSQTITSYVNGKESSRISLSKEELLTINIKNPDTKQKEIYLSFNISNPIRPTDINPLSSDTRLLGIAFENVIIKVL
jgi:hypothetical protein